MDRYTLFAILFSIALLNSAYSLASSVSPSSIIINNALKGGEMFRELNVGNPNPINVNVSLQVRGDIQNFVFLNETAFVLSPREVRTVKLTIKPSKETPIGYYKGDVLVSVSEASAEGPSGTGSKIMVGVVSLIEVNVTGEERKGIEVLSARIERTEWPIPTTLRYRVHNTGNVYVKPYHVLNIYKISQLTGVRGRLAKTISAEGESVMPAEFKNIIDIVPVSDLEADRYDVNLKIYIDKFSYERGEKAVYDKNMSLYILPKGSLSMSGEIREAYLEYSKVGYPVKVTAEFINTGDYAISVQLIIDLYKDGILMSNLKSEEIDASPGKAINISLYYTPLQAGTYVLKIRAKYWVNTGRERIGAKETDIIERKIEVEGEAFPIVYVSIAIIVLLTLSYLLVRKKTSKKRGKIAKTRKRGKYLNKKKT